MDSDHTPASAPPAPPAPPARPSRRALIGRVLLFVLLLAASVLVVNLAWRLLGIPRPRVGGAIQPVPFFAFMLVVSAFTVGVAAFVLRRTEGRSLAALGLSVGRGTPGAIAAGALAGFLPVGVTAALALAFGYGTIAPAGGDAGWLAGTLTPFLLGTTLISMWEEIVWRGYMLHVLEQGPGRWAAVLLTAFLWAGGHLANDGATPLGLLPTALSGVVLAWIVLRTGSLWFAFAYHVAWNVSSIHVLGLTTSGFLESASFLRTDLHGPAWLIGGAYGFEASLPTACLDIATLATILYFVTRSRSASDPSGPPAPPR
ncbi:MAG: lysostaphin resistance A-like protein [Hyphomicrobiales bacterium]